MFPSKILILCGLAPGGLRVLSANTASGSRTSTDAPFDAQLARSCMRKRVLFVGDSTMQEVMWTLILLTSCSERQVGSCAPIDPRNLPVANCVNRRCALVGQKYTLEQHNEFDPIAKKGEFRCFTMDACTRQGEAYFSAAHVPLFASFIWSGSGQILRNGGGLASSFGSREWLQYFYEVATVSVKEPFDAVLFTAGMHDVFNNHRFTHADADVRAKAWRAYAHHLDSALDRLGKLAPIRVFMTLSRRQLGRWAVPPLNDIDRTIHADVLRNNTGWTTAIDASGMSTSEHCAVSTYNSTVIGLDHTANCTALARCVGRLLCGETVGAAPQGRPVMECT